MSWAGWILPAPAEYAPKPLPCVVLCNPDSDTARCSRPAGEHTALDYPICAGCWEAVSDETVDRTPRPAALLGGPCLVDPARST